MVGWLLTTYRQLAFFQGGVGSWAGALLFKTGRFSMANKEIGLATGVRCVISFQVRRTHQSFVSFVALAGQYVLQYLYLSNS
jgi:hypothetical protein